MGKELENKLKDDEKYEMVNHPSHYNKYDIEVIEMMRRIWGDDDVAIWCKLSAFKYRMRLGEKPKNTIEQDIRKEKFCLDYIAKLNTKNFESGDKALLVD